MCAFFFSSLDTVLRHYPNLFGEERSQPSEDEGEGGEAGGNSWGWLAMIDRMAGGDRSKWGYFLNMQLIEWLNTVAFCTDKWRQRDERLGRSAKQGAQVFTAAALSELLK